eukprot:TRINITY_DN3920_c0_g1_i1.p1 TRINITY_DN3920_c0_g1~~TRINITY_DN3920_c0_g1_i1.p1  ORF type:complete len:123 (-),score=33.95 TRINITY_DN3920_c0_g1_i1:38-406(-)
MCIRDRFQLDFDEAEREIIGVDHIMFDTGFARVGHTRCQRRLRQPFRCFDGQIACCHRHHDIIHPVAVPAGVTAGRKAPFRHHDPVGLKLLRTSGKRACIICLLYTSPSPRDRTRSRMPSSA